MAVETVFSVLAKARLNSAATSQDENIGFGQWATDPAARLFIRRVRRRLSFRETSKGIVVGHADDLQMSDMSFYDEMRNLPTGRYVLRF